MSTMKPDIQVNKSAGLLSDEFGDRDVEFAFQYQQRNNHKPTEENGVTQKQTSFKYNMSKIIQQFYEWNTLRKQCVKIEFAQEQFMSIPIELSEKLKLWRHFQENVHLAKSALDKDRTLLDGFKVTIERKRQFVFTVGALVVGLCCGYVASVGLAINKSAFSITKLYSESNQCETEGSDDYLCKINQ